MNIPVSYTLLHEERIPELNSQAFLSHHPKSGARLFLLSNEDNNKVFTIGFRTPASDSTGVPHILEHSVLCGSKKFPVKDPFIELQKSSLQTYLNAMTFADKTIYPVASCNDKDFQNLMDVYMDAVLHPLIHENEKIFQQEGWHYELESPEEELKINGVVYNEMKGAFSSPEEVLERYSQAVLFPDTTYRHESGGDPDQIPALTYEEFLEFHRTYYHPSNSYIYLYGDMDMEEKLRWLDQEYLSHYNAIEADSEITMQKPFDAPVEQEIFYPLASEDNTENQTYLSMQCVLGKITDPILYMSFQILEYAMLTAPGAPLKQALLDAGIGKDVFGGYRNWTLQPYFTLVAKNTEKEKKEDFNRVIRESLQDMVQKGIDEKSLLAAINNLEFRSKEADFGPYPKGLMYGIECFDSWLYDEKDPLMHLKYEDTFAFLKSQVKKGYFENLIKEYFLDNPHQATVILSPKAGLAEEKEAQLKKELAAYKASLGEDGRESLVRATKELDAYQDAAPTREELDTLPMLTREDLREEEVPLFNRPRKIGDTSIIHHEMFTGGIGYLRLLLNAAEIARDDLPYLGFLRSILCLVDTKDHSYQELFNEINIHTGGIGSSLSCFEKVEEPGNFTPYFEINTKVMYDKLEVAFSLMGEILKTSSFRDEKRMRELVAQFKSRGEIQLLNSGHSAAVLRGSSYGSAVSYYNEQIGGIDYYRFLEDLNQNFDERKSILTAKLEELSERLFVKGNLIVSYTADENGYQVLEKDLPKFVTGLGTSGAKTASGIAPMIQKYPLEKKNEGFKTAGLVQYVARCGNFRAAGLPYKGTLRVLKAILSDEYLWNHVRVKGGAYGCMCNFGRNGGGFFVSYRDPNLGKTNQVYENLVHYLENFTMNEKDIVKFIIGAIGSMDRPMNPSEWGVTSLQAYLNGVTPEMRRTDRCQVLNCTQEDIRELAAHVKAVLEQNQLCVLGNAGKIEEEKELFYHTENLFH